MDENVREKLRLAGFVLIAFIVQIVGYAALIAVFPHSYVTPLVDDIRALPTVALTVLAVLAIPAVLLGLGFGTALSVVFGVQPESFPAVLLADGDVFVFIGAAALAVASVMVAHRAGVLS
jgi:hypothetical protein